jgi:threonine synthase
MHVCEFCFGPLEVDYDYASIKKDISKKAIGSGPNSIWRYHWLLPASEDRSVNISTGYTPLLKSDRLAKLLGLKELYLKNDTVNPTWSFKDRVVSVALSAALELGFDTLACASTGNLANSVSAHAAKAGLPSYIFIPADLERGKVLTTGVYGANLIAVDGNYDDVNRLCSEISAEYPWAFVNINVRPFYAEGSKTLAFETAEQLDWQAPDHVVVPAAPGSLLTKIYKGLNELNRVGLIGEIKTKASAAQAEGCSPITTAYKNKTLNVKPVKPHTIAKSLAIGNPADGYYALKTIRESKGYAESVTDEEIVSAIKLLAETEGIFAETAGGVTVGVLKKLVEAGKIKKNERVVAYITGAGLKTLEAVKDAIEPPVVIKPTLASFKDILRN